MDDFKSFFLSVWNFIADEDNRARLGMLGAAFAAVAAALWAVFTHFHRKKLEEEAIPKSGNNRGAVEKAIRDKTEAEHAIFKRALGQQPYENQRIESNIGRDYAPYAVLAQSTNLRVDIYIIPLIQHRIETETKLRRQHRAPYDPRRIAQIRKEVRTLIAQEWPSIVYASFLDAMEHVRRSQGMVFDYKKKELLDYAERLVARGPQELFVIVDEMLQKAQADSVLQS